MGLPTKWAGVGTDTSYPAIRFQQWSYFFKRGTVRIPDDAEWPTLSNGEMVALARAWKAAASRARAPWPLWYDITVEGLGYHGAGDKFVMSTEHMKAPASPELVRTFWLGTAVVAQQLDELGAPRAPLVVDWSKRAYEAAARDAWAQMKVESPATLPPLPELPTPKPPPTPPVPGRPDVPIDPTPTLPGGGAGIGLLVAVIAVVAIISNKKRRKGR